MLYNADEELLVCNANECTGSFTSIFSLLTASPQGRQGDPGPQGIDGARVSHIYGIFFFSYA